MKRVSRSNEAHSLRQISVSSCCFALPALSTLVALTIQPAEIAGFDELLSTHLPRPTVGTILERLPPFSVSGRGKIWKGISGGRRKEVLCCSVTGPKVKNGGSRNAERRTESGTRRWPTGAEYDGCGSIVLWLFRGYRPHGYRHYFACEEQKKDTNAADVVKNISYT